MKRAKSVEQLTQAEFDTLFAEAASELRTRSNMLANVKSSQANVDYYTRERDNHQRVADVHYAKYQAIVERLSNAVIVEETPS